MEENATSVAGASASSDVRFARFGERRANCRLRIWSEMTASRSAGDARCRHRSAGSAKMKRRVRRRTVAGDQSRRRRRCGRRRNQRAKRRHRRPTRPEDDLAAFAAANHAAAALAGGATQPPRSSEREKRRGGRETRERQTTRERTRRRWSPNPSPNVAGWRDARDASNRTHTQSRMSRATKRRCRSSPPNPREHPPRGRV